MQDLNELRYPKCQDIPLMAEKTGWDELPVVLDQLSNIRWVLETARKSCDLGRAVKASGWLKTWEAESKTLLGFVA